MHRPTLFLAFIILAISHIPAWGQTVPPAQAPAFSIEVDRARPATIGGREHHFEMATVRRTDLEGPLPVAIILHGKPADAATAATYHVDRYLSQAKDLAARGWLVLIVMREGYGYSDGTFQTVQHTTEGFAEFARAGARDVSAILDQVLAGGTTQPTILLVSVSTGGFIASELAVELPGQVKAVIEVSPGLRTEGVDTVPMQEDFFRAIAGHHAAAMDIIYEAHDTVIPPAQEERLISAYSNAGGAGTSLRFNDPKASGHAAFVTFEGRINWLREADDFLSGLGLPAFGKKEEDRIYAAMPIPSSRKMLEAYAHAPGEKALAASPSGVLHYWAGASTMNRARAQALDLCRTTSHQDCRIVFEDQTQVERGPLPGIGATP